jgi:Tfp pilus assembly protein FimT
MTYHRNRKSAGMSLMEALIGLAVVIALSAFALPRLLRYWQSYQLDSATQTLSSNLEIARYTAISKKCNVAAHFYAGASWYELFEDKNENGVKDAGEFLLGAYSLPGTVQFNGSGLVGPPASPSGAVSDPITFAGDRVVFNPSGRINSGLGTIYLKNSAGDASALSFNMASRMRIYRWNKANLTWN